MSLLSRKATSYVEGEGLGVPVCPDRVLRGGGEGIAMAANSMQSQPLSCLY